MLQIKKLYRSEYTGEEVVTEMSHIDGQWNYTKEFITNSVINNRITSQAIVIGSGFTRSMVDLVHIKNHKGGLLASNKLQSYGCNNLYKEFEPDFLVAVGKEIIDEVADSGYTNNHIVYTGAQAILDHPGKFYLVPQDPSWNAGSIATYLAAFDGHTKIFLLGFDTSNADAFWARSMSQVFSTYNETEFVLIVPSLNADIPEEWKYLLNVRPVTVNEFVVEADL
jgi:hypothetical protein